MRPLDNESISRCDNNRENRFFDRTVIFLAGFLRMVSNLDSCVPARADKTEIPLDKLQYSYPVPHS